MASYPPFLVEDQTDEDFFDNLVNDDDDKTGLAVHKLTDSNESDDASAFANLTIGEDSASKTDSFDGKEKDPVGAGPAPAYSDGYNNSLGFDNSLTDSNDHGEEGARSEVGLDRDLSKNSGSVNSGVKEVGWNSFYADSNENGVHGFGSYSDFFNDFGENSTQDFPGKADVKANQPVLDQNSVSSYGQYHEGGQVYEASTTDNGNVQDLNSSQYWENMYPGWKYDPNTGQWYQDGGYPGNLQSSYDSFGGDCNGVTDVKADVSYLQQAVQSVAGTMKTAVNGATEGVTNWNQLSQVNNGYPENMIFDPQYPGWYYDTIAQEWRALESYNASAQSTILSTDQGHDQQNKNGVVSTIGNSQINSSSVYSEYGQGYNYGSQGLGSPSEHGNCGESYVNYGSQGVNVWQQGTAANTEEISQKQQLDSSYGSKMFVNNHVNHFKSTCSSPQEVQLLNNVNQFQAEANGVVGLRSFIHSENLNHQFKQTSLKQNEQIHFSNDFNGSQKYVNVARQPLQESQQFSYASNTGRSSAVRPPHPLVTFGFGGKLIVMKNSKPQSSSFSSQESLGASISVLNLMEVVHVSTNGSGAGLVACDYFRTLCQQSFPGPLVGGNVGSKELNKWIDDKIANCISPDMDYSKGEVLRLLISLLKISCQYYGKLRSPFGADTVLKETDTPESSIAKLFASAKKNDKTYGALSHCLQQLPSEGQVRAIATEVQNLLVSGRKKEALQCAQEGQLWGPALVLASQFGDQFFVDTVKQMALRQLIAGSPLRTLCLLIAGQQAEVFSAGTTINSMNMSQQHAQLGANCMLDDWEENLAVITANRTKDDELVIIHLGDCLWRERSEITAAHICYLVAEANFEPYSDSARLCLIGADHWNFPRTYASPEAIQRTELYEYSKVTGNSQFILMPFQPYKLIYAHMLAEVGKFSESLKYCQAVLKSLKPNRTAEVETWKQAVLSLEDRIRIHQQGGYAANLAPAKLVGKLLNFFDSTAHRVVGGPPPIAPSASNGNFQGNDPLLQQTGSRVSSSQSTMAISSLMSSTSMEPISDWVADGKMTVQNRSVSEPDFGRTPRQVDSTKEAGASTAQGKASGSVGASRFAHFGFGSQLLQKTVGLVLRPRADKQAKLGEKNKFYYDEKLKRWVEEGAELPAEKAALPPPPTTSSLQNGTSDYNLKSALETEGSPTNVSPKFRNPTPMEHASGIPPIPTSSNQFSARGRMGVRARYVDTFNRGGGHQANLFQSPAVPSVKPAMASNAKFFIPTPVSTSKQSMESITGSGQEENTTNHPTTSDAHESLISSMPSQSKNNMQRFPSMDSLGQKGNMSNANGEAYSRRTASWSGQNFADALSPPGKSEFRPLGKMLGMPQSSFIPSPSNGSFGDELHEVEL